ncbi:MAG TPA: MmcQ/YjbR family DNA-binding protein [Phenylobacterium sp.]|uniref:MmcQ/YjbR family DNA-binding protein n=1 Tax=Phenylobacterium sp. TaxID=1871053 RepID=UPI002C880530|nr:MmcQ/YjbR family DNA-binding protein [Phenylobacterium sp.]HSV04184.1 MmcQ/YjbR family DNA-binding protein [Phenylobacterium sp.]
MSLALTRDEIGAIALGLPATSKVVQWGGSDVYKVGGKVFAMCGDIYVAFKVTDIGFVVLTEDGPGRQAPYCAKGQWVAVDLDRLDPNEAQGWISTAHALIAAKLAKKVRAELGL